MSLGERSVIAAVSAGARAVVDRVMAEAPMWKVEVDGAHLRVEGTLPQAP